MSRDLPVRGRRQRPPTHPGEVLREDVLPALDLSVSEAARQLRISGQNLQSVLSGKAGISTAMAVRLGKFCGNGPEIWLRLQQNHDLWHAEQRLTDEVKKIPGHSAQ